MLLALIVSVPARAHGSSYAEANRAYESGDFAAALAQYRALVAAGVVHEELYYNLGNAYFRTGALGPAMYNYERALRIAPGFDDARYNLTVAREAVADRVADRLKGAETDPLWIRAVTIGSIGFLTGLFLVLDYLLFGGLIACRFVANGFTRTTLLVTSGFTAVFALGVTIALVGHIVFLAHVPLGVVLPTQLQMREGADEQSAERAPVHAGLRVRIIDREPGWLRVRLANGTEGWVPQQEIGEL